MEGRDPVTGRFLPGNQIAKKNKGNQKGKWGNRNAIKHGLFGMISPLARLYGDCLMIYITPKRWVQLGPGEFLIDDEERIRIRDDMAEILEKMGVKLEEL